MKYTSEDTCLLYKRSNHSVDVVVTLQVDDTFGHGSPKFLQREEENSKAFICKPRNSLTPGNPQDFNGCTILHDKDGSYSLHQGSKLSCLSMPNNTEELISLRAKLQYIGCCTRPDICTKVQMMANEVRDPTETGNYI